MKAHIYSDSDSRLVHSLTCTAAHVSDVGETEHLLHRQEELVLADAGHIGSDKRDGLEERSERWHIAMKRGPIKATATGGAERNYPSSRAAQGPHPGPR